MNPLDHAVSLIGIFKPDCEDCCSAKTDGDLCEPCKEIQAHIAAGIVEGLSMAARLVKDRHVAATIRALSVEST